MALSAAPDGVVIESVDATVSVTLVEVVLSLTPFLVLVTMTR